MYGKYKKSKESFVNSADKIIFFKVHLEYIRIYTTYK